MSKVTQEKNKDEKYIRRSRVTLKIENMRPNTLRCLGKYSGEQKEVVTMVKKINVEIQPGFCIQKKVQIKKKMFYTLSKSL